MYEGKDKRDCRVLLRNWKCFSHSFNFRYFKTNCLQMVKKVQKIVSFWVQMDWYKKKIYKTKTYLQQNITKNFFGYNKFKEWSSFWVKKDKIHAWEFSFR